MKRTLYIASAVSVLVTTLTYGHSMYRTMAHLVTHHGQGFFESAFATFLRDSVSADVQCGITLDE